MSSWHLICLQCPLPNQSEIQFKSIKQDPVTEWANEVTEVGDRSWVRSGAPQRTCSGQRARPQLRVPVLTSLPATCFSLSSTSPWRNTTTPFGRRSRPCRLSWHGGAGHCICMNACAEWTVAPAPLRCPLDAQPRPTNSPDNLPPMDTVAARKSRACSRLLAPLPQPSNSLQVRASTSPLASALPHCPRCPLTLS